jgi:hypothetical protein
MHPETGKISQDHNSISFVMPGYELIIPICEIPSYSTNILMYQLLTVILKDENPDQNTPNGF